MLQLKGQVINVVQRPEGVTKEGKEYGGDYQVQLLCEESLRNGETRMQLYTLRADNVESFRKLQGRTVSVPVGAFASGNQIQFYLQKNATPTANAAGTDSQA